MYEFLNAGNRSKLNRGLTLAATLIVSLSAHAESRAQTQLNVSVKIVRDSYGGLPTSKAEVETAIADANNVLQRNGADWRLILDEVRTLANVTEWSTVDCADKGLMERDAERDPSRFAWRYDAINIYVTNLTTCGGVCSFPHFDEDIILVTGDFPSSASAGVVWLHEIGHYLGLLHSFQCLTRTGQPCASDPEICTGAGGFDEAGGVWLCRDICPDDNNLMSYHPYIYPENATLTPCQLEIIGWHIDSDRANVIRGLTPPGGEDDEHEDNDDPSEATRIGARTLELMGMDQDWFVFNLEAGQELSVEMNGAQGNLDLFIFDEQGVEMGRSTSAGSNESVLGIRAGGDVYIAVAPYQRRVGAYSLRTSTRSIQLPPLQAPSFCGAGAPAAMLLGMFGLACLRFGPASPRRSLSDKACSRSPR